MFCLFIYLFAVFNGVRPFNQASADDRLWECLVYRGIDKLVSMLKLDNLIPKDGCQMLGKVLTFEKNRISLSDMINSKWYKNIHEMYDPKRIDMNLDIEMNMNSLNPNCHTDHTFDNSPFGAIFETVSCDDNDNNNHNHNIHKTCSHDLNSDHKDSCTDCKKENENLNSNKYYCPYKYEFEYENKYKYKRELQPNEKLMQYQLKGGSLDSDDSDDDDDIDNIDTIDNDDNDNGISNNINNTDNNNNRENRIDNINDHFGHLITS